MAKNKPWWYGQCIQVAGAIGKIAERLVNQDSRVSSLRVTARPLVINGFNGSSIELTLSGRIGEVQRDVANQIFQNGFKETIYPTLNQRLGWTHFRIRSCPRDHSESKKCWLIEERDRTVGKNSS